MKKVFILLVASMLAVSCFLGEGLAEKIALSDKAKEKIKEAVVLKVGSNKAYVRGEEKEIDKDNPQVKPEVKDGRTLVVLRFVAESLGATVNWDEGKREVKVVLQDKEIRLVLGQPEMLVNGEKKPLEVAAEAINGRTYLPLRAVAEALDKEVFYDQGLIVIEPLGKHWNKEADKEIISELLSLFGEDQSSEEPLFPIKEADKIGYIDKTGRCVWWPS